MKSTPDEVTHTPGPWTCDNRLFVLAGHGDERFTLASVSPRWVGADYATKAVDEANANARLITAAPELLAACEAALVNLIDARANGIGQGSVIAQVERAITLAKGGAL